MRVLMFLAVVGALLIGLLVVAIVSNTPNQEPYALGAIAGVALVTPALLVGAWRVGWALYRQTVKEARRAHRH